MLLLVEGSTGGERKEFLGGEGQKEFAPEEMEHIQVCLFSVMRAQAMFHKVKGSGTLPLFLFTMSVKWVANVIHGHI